MCQCWEPWYLKVAPLSWTVTPLSLLCHRSPSALAPLPGCGWWRQQQDMRETKPGLGTTDFLLPFADTLALNMETAFLWQHRWGSCSSEREGVGLKSHSSWGQSRGWPPGLLCGLCCVTTVHFCQGRALSFTSETGRWDEGQPRNRWAGMSRWAAVCWLAGWGGVEGYRSPDS